jgi:hypothetical protein
MASRYEKYTWIAPVFMPSSSGWPAESVARQPTIRADLGSLTVCFRSQEECGQTLGIFRFPSLHSICFECPARRCACRLPASEALQKGEGGWKAFLLNGRKGVPGQGYLHRANSQRHRNMACSAPPRRNLSTSETFPCKLLAELQASDARNSRLTSTGRAGNTVWFANAPERAGGKSSAASSRRFRSPRERGPVADVAGRKRYPRAAIAFWLQRFPVGMYVNKP